jgi:hypothetical protein
MNGFPSALERLGLMAINRARSDPQTVKGASSASYPARPPVIWSLVLNQSARFWAVVESLLPGHQALRRQLDDWTALLAA